MTHPMQEPAYAASELTSTLITTLDELKERMALLTRQAEFVKDTASNEERVAMLKEFQAAHADYWDCERAFHASKAFDQIEDSEGWVIQ